MNSLERGGQQLSQANTYYNSPNAGPRLTSAANNYIPNAQKTTYTDQDDMQKQLEEFNKSVTIIIWYKANAEPIRLQQVIPTFPYLQLSRIPSLTSDLGLTTTSYLDTYNPSSGQWEQHTIGTIRIVDAHQRLLYKIRKSLLDGLDENDCSGLMSEVERQPKPKVDCPPSPPLTIKAKSPPAVVTNDTSNDSLHKGPPKRPGSDILESSNTTKVHVTDSHYMAHSSGSSSSPETATRPGSSTLSMQTSEVNPTTKSARTVNAGSNGSTNSPYSYESTLLYANPSPSSSTQQSSDASLPQYMTSPSLNTISTIPYHPHPPLKRWPNDYTVAELSMGFQTMEDLVSQSPNGSNLTQRAAFERVFGSRYVKSTVCRHRAVWRKAHHSLREQFEAMGSDERACWGEFVRRVEGRPPGKMVGSHANGELSPSEGILGFRGQAGNDRGGTLSARGSENTSGSRVSRKHTETREIIQEPVMASLQHPAAQGPSAPSANVNIYDPMLSQVGNNARS